jgi:hypothetical protein
MGEERKGAPDRKPDPTAPHDTGAIRSPEEARDPEAAAAGGARRTGGPMARGPGVGHPAEQVAPVPEEPLLLGRPPQAHEPERPEIGLSVSQPPPGATGEHANPVGPGEPTATAPRLPPGAAVLPRRDPGMPATGAARGPHGPGPDADERRVTQQDWARWRAADRRKAPFEYPTWRS